MNEKTQPNRVRPTARSTKPRWDGRALRTALGLPLLVGGCLLLLIVLGGATQLSGQRSVAQIGQPSPNLNPLERFLLSWYLAANTNALHSAPDKLGRQVAFDVQSGEGAGQVSERLGQLGLVQNPTLLRWYLRYTGGDARIEVGRYELSSNQTLQQVADALGNAGDPDRTVRIWEGWRLEQVASGLAQNPVLTAFDEPTFLALAQHPSPTLRQQFPFLALLPANASLEGFLFPDTYKLAPITTAEQALLTFLSNFGTRLPPDWQTQALNQGLSFYEVVTLASIVEREAVLASERPIIAGVFLERLAQGMRLDADPTTQYGIATDANWWPPLNFDPRTVNHAYNTYIINGLPPTPIANPSLAAIIAVLQPQRLGYLYFRASCARDGSHNFSYTYEEHVQKGCP